MPAPTPVGPLSEAPTASGGLSWAGSDCVHSELSAPLDASGWRRPSSKASMAASAAGRSTGTANDRAACPASPDTIGSSARPTAPALTRVARSSPCSSRRLRHGRALASATCRATATVCSASDRHRSSPATARDMSPSDTRSSRRASHGRSPGPWLSTSGSTGASSPSGLAISARLRSKAARPSSNSSSSSASVWPAAAVASPKRANSARAPVRRIRVDSIRVSSSTAPSGSITMRSGRLVEDGAGRRHHLEPREIGGQSGGLGCRPVEARDELSPRGVDLRRDLVRGRECTRQGGEQDVG